MGFETGVLAPLQVIMLRDSLAAPEEGRHVEQLEIVFRGNPAAEDVLRAWSATVAQTAVLGMGFTIPDGEPVGWAKADFTPRPCCGLMEIPSWEEWLAEDRTVPLLEEGKVPWRAVFQPAERRFVWTFHHALLDGRSITRIIGNFLKCLETGAPPTPLALSVWQPPSAEVVRRAGELLEKDLDGFLMPPAAPPVSAGEKQTACLGSGAAGELMARASAFDVTPSTLLTWAWGQAVARASGARAAIVEQVRCGPPQPGTAGFSMNTLPLVIPLADSAPLEKQLHAFRRKLLAMRGFESVGPHQLPDRVAEAANGPWSGVLMTEHATLRHSVGGGRLVESIRLHEPPGESLTATACVLPDLRLEVEGICGSGLLEAWISILGEVR